MYRLVLYFLIALCVLAAVLGLFGVLPYSPLAILISVIFITLVSLVTNDIFAVVFKAPKNVESVYITALILVLIITPLQAGQYMAYFPLAFWASVWAMASKYIFAIKRKHIFNPAAFAVALTSVTISQSATWWVGTMPMVFLVFVGGALIVRKIKRADLVVSFLATALVFIYGAVILQDGLFTALSNSALQSVSEKALLYSPLFFFAFIMLTEPLTTPPTRKLRIVYGILVGCMFVPSFHIGSFYFTPEIALLVGNIFVYIVSPKQKLLLTLRKKVQVAAGVYDFWFTKNQKFAFAPGQYLEWTLATKSKNDARGNRRYFTIASSPTENDLAIGVKFYSPSSTFKNELLLLKEGDTIVASQLAGDFTLPKDPQQKLVFISGGIGVTPFRSMIKYLTDKNERRPIVHFYANKTEDDIAYRDIFDEAEKKVGIRTIYTIGRITTELLTNEVPDLKDHIFYISGPRAMVDAFSATLKELGIPKRHVKTDYFPGFA